MTRRSRRTPAQWQTIIQNHRDSGLSVRQFCEANDFNYSVFSKWRNRLAGHNAPLIELKPVAEPLAAPLHTTWDIELELGDGAVLRLRRG